MTRETHSPQLFLCYSSRDWAKVKEGVLRPLQNKKISVWYDREGLAATDYPDEKIGRALNSCRRILAVLSDGWFESSYTKREVSGRADDVILLALDGNTSRSRQLQLPVPLRGKTIISFFHKDWVDLVTRAIRPEPEPVVPIDSLLDDPDSLLDDFDPNNLEVPKVSWPEDVYIEVPGPMDPQSLAQLQRRMKTGRVLVLSGPQLCGKKQLTKKLIDLFSESRATPIRAPLVYESFSRISEKHLKADDHRLGPEEIEGRELLKYWFYAVWASQMLRKYLEGLDEDSRLELEKDSRAHVLNNIAEDTSYAAKRIAIRHREDLGQTPGEEFSALVDVVRDALATAGQLEDQNVFLILVLEVHDFHRYQQSLDDGTSRELAQQLFDSFWSALEAHTHSKPPYNIETSPCIRIIVTLRPCSLDDGPACNKNKSPHVRIGPCTVEGIESYIKLLGFGENASDESITQFAKSVHKVTAGYRWFVIRFLKSVYFLSRLLPGESLEDLFEEVRRCPVFWYWQSPWKRFKEALEERKIALIGVPSQGSEYSRFLKNVLMVATKREANFLDRYKEMLRSPASFSEAHNESQLPLVQLGLVRLDPGEENWIPWNELIERFFSPQAIRGILEERKV